MKQLFTELLQTADQFQSISARSRSGFSALSWDAG
jgi:hypothetical protein